MTGDVPVSWAANPGCWPDQHDAEPQARPVRRWRIVHACDTPLPAALLATAQLEIGMRPLLMTSEEPLAPDAPLSIVHEWREVRLWRQRFVLDAGTAEVLHAHSFAAAMAGTRGPVAVVYDFAAPIGAANAPKSRAWQLRSLRVAEQFALSRAGAVVTHSNAMRSEVLQRGVSSEDVFLVPDPVEIRELSWRTENRCGSGLTVFACEVRKRSMVLEAFAALLRDVHNARLLMEVTPGSEDSVRIEAARAGVHAVDLIGPDDRERAVATSDVVIAGGSVQEAPSPVLITALAQGRAVLAADVAPNREVSPEGHGCVWYRHDDARDLAARAAFLAQNADFRVSLGISGRAHLEATRSPRIVARKYDDVYRHAFQRRYHDNADILPKLEIVRACL